ncbi:MAG: dicarboxylate/amino acid:cation symporter [Candidatus Kapaibacterium sp.]
MKLPKIPLHIQILVALALGSVFGAIFNVDPHKLRIKYTDTELHEHKTTIENWDELRVVIPRETDYGIKIDTAAFGAEDQIQIIKYYKKLSRKKKLDATIEIIKNQHVVKSYENVVSIRKIPTIATEIKFIGDIFIRLLSFLAIPLVIASLIAGAASLGDIKKLGRIGGKTFIIYIITTAFAITIGLSAANLIQPGRQVDAESSNRLMGTFKSESSEKMVDEMEIDIIEFFVDVVPTNPIEAMASGNMLQIVFFAVLFGITLTFIEKKYSEPVLSLFNGISETMIKMVDLIMKIAPYGVFALIAATIADFGFNILSTLVWYIVAVLIGLLFHTIVVYSSLVRFVGKSSPMAFFKGIRNAQAIGFSTSSSAATLPVTFECVEQNLGVPKQISGFVLPLGATINMDGTALYQGVAAVFIAQVYGFDLGIAEQLTIVITAVLASIGTAPVPGVGIIMLVMILQAVHVPPEGIALILGVDRILDMCRTVTNVSGDAAVTMAIAGSEKE